MPVSPPPNRGYLQVEGGIEVYGRPLTATINCTTNAVANTLSSHTLLPALTGLRYLLHSVFVSLQQGEPTANQFRFMISNRVAGQYIWMASLNQPSFPSAGHIFAYPFVDMNTAVSQLAIADSVCTAVSRVLVCNINYYQVPN